MQDGYKNRFQRSLLPGPQNCILQQQDLTSEGVRMCCVVKHPQPLKFYLHKNHNFMNTSKFNDCQLHTVKHPQQLVQHFAVLNTTLRLDSVSSQWILTTHGFHDMNTSK